MTIYILDLTILSIILGFSILGFLSGFSGKILHWISWGAAVVLACLLFPYGASFLKTHGGEALQSEWASQGLSFVLIFLFFLFGFGWISKTLSSLIKKSKVGMLDRNLGIVLGAITGVFFLSILILGSRFIMTPDESSNFFQNSKFYPLLETCSDQICLWAPDAFLPDAKARQVHDRELEKARQEATMNLARLAATPS